MPEHRIASVAPAEPVTEAGYRLRWLATPPTPRSFSIGNLNVDPAPQETATLAGALLDGVLAGWPAKDLEEMIKAIEADFALPAFWCRRSPAARDDAPFLSPHAPILGGLMAILAHAGARRGRTDIVLESDKALPPDLSRNGPLLDDLLPAERAILSDLQRRKGRVGRDLEIFWVVAATLGLAPGASLARRYYSASQFIPKIRLDEHLVQIEQKPLLDQLEDMISQGCHGLAWVRAVECDPEDFPDETLGILPEGHGSAHALHMHLESLTFDRPEIVSQGLQDINDQLMREAADMLSEALP